MNNFDRFSDKLVYGYNTRHGGVSTGIYESMDLSMNMGDDPELVRQNYEIWCGGMGIDTHDTVMVNQTHTNKVIRVDESNRGQGLYSERIYGVDAMVTNCKGLALVTSHADCVPVYIYDPVNEAIGLAHAGWRGTVGQIVRNTVEMMTSEFGSNPADMYAMIGPCISIKHFECDRDVIDAIDAMDIDCSSMYYYIEAKNKYHASLSGINKLVLEASGISEDRIDMCDTCTYERADLYFSHRRQGRNRGGQAAILSMRR